MKRAGAVRIAQAAIVGYRQALKEQVATDPTGGNYELLDEQLKTLDDMEIFVTLSWDWLKEFCNVDEAGRDRG